MFYDHSEARMDFLEQILLHFCIKKTDCSELSPVTSVFQKKEWLCLNCQTQRLMSGGGLDDPPLPVPHPSPKHQPMGSPRHQAPATQQSPLHKPASQQSPKTTQSQMQKPPAGTGVGSPFAPAAAKQPADTKTTTPPPPPVATAEAQKQTKPTEEKPKTEPEIQTSKETKPSQKKGEPITPIKDIKKSRHYDVSLISFLPLRLRKAKSQKPIKNMQ